MRNIALNLLIIICIPFGLLAQASDTTYAERLGYPKGAKVLILHVDDAGMSYASNAGAEMALTKGWGWKSTESVLIPSGKGHPLAATPKSGRAKGRESTSRPRSTSRSTRIRTARTTPGTSDASPCRRAKLP